MTTQQIIDTINQKKVMLLEHKNRKYLVISIAIIGVIAVGITTLAISNSNTTPSPATPIRNTPIQQSKSLLDEPISLSFSPPVAAVAAVDPKATGKVDLVLFTPDNRYFTDITFVLKYDPKMLQNVTVSKSTFEYSPVLNFKVLKNNVDTTTGTIEITYSSSQAQIARGGIATLSFKPSGPFTSLRTTINLTSDSYASLPNGEKYPLTPNEFMVMFPDIAPLR